jgi:hypothetical protein
VTKPNPNWGSLKEMTYEERARDFLTRMGHIPSDMVKDGVLQVGVAELYATLYVDVPAKAERVAMLTTALQNACILFSEGRGRWVLRTEVIGFGRLLADEVRKREMDEVDLDRATKIARLLL